MLPHHRIVSEDREMFAAVSRVLSQRGISVNAASINTLTHVVGHITPKAMVELAKVGPLLDGEPL